MRQACLKAFAAVYGYWATAHTEMERSGIEVRGSLLFNKRNKEKQDIKIV
jgi:hypothetical protein